MKTPEEWLKHLHENTDDCFDPENVAVYCDVIDVIRAAQAEARADEREACARICQEHGQWVAANANFNAATNAAAAIRARGGAK